jgi:hypothetical protein
MALQDKDILITPNRGQTAEPKIDFKGASASLGPQTISLNVYPTNNGTISFEGSAGQLFSITNDLSGTIYSVNDVSGIPSIEVLDTGLVKLAQYSGNVLIGTGTDNGQKFQVAGITALGTNLANYLTVTGAATGNAVGITTAGTDANIGLTITTKGTGNIILDTGTSTGDVEIRPGASNFRLYDDDSSHYYRFVTGNIAANYDITFPAGNVTLQTGTMVATTRTISTTSPVTGGGDLSANRTIALATGYGDTQNPYASKTANQFLAAPNGSAGVPTFRAIVAADIPTLNQSTTGNAGTVTNGVYTTGNQTIGGVKTFSSAPVSANGYTIGSGAFISTYSGGDYSTLIGGTNSGTLIKSISNGHVAIMIDGNDDLDSFSVVSHSLTAGTADNKTPDKLAFSVRRQGDATFAGAVTGSSFNLITGLSSTNPAMNGTVAVGTGTTVARADHVHPVDTSRAAVGQTMHIGTTSVAINRASAALTLAGITLTTPVIGAATGTSLLATGEVSGAFLGVENTVGTNGRGLSLYGGGIDGQPTYGVMFQGTATFGTYGPVNADWATYFTMSNTTGRGWIFKSNTGTSGNVAGISAAGAAQFASNVTVGGTLTVSGTTNTAGHFYGGTTAPASTNRLNYNGYLYATRFYGDGSQLTGISAGANGGGSDKVFYENDQTVNTNYTITTNKNAMTAGPITVANGVTVTIPNGSVWTVV